VATSGVAALLLEGGRTAHSRFKLPLDVTSTSTCSISKQSPLGLLLRSARVILWDELFMAHRYLLDALNRTYEDLVDAPGALMDNKVFIGGGDKRQILPVVPRGGEPEILNAAVTRSPLWPRFQKLSLTTNMRVLMGVASSEQVRFADFLLRVGDGVADVDAEGKVDIPLGQRAAELDSLIRSVYDDIENNIGNIEYFASRAILTPRNTYVIDINQRVGARFTTQARTYVSSDSIVEGDDPEQARLFPDEFLHSLNVSGMPPHSLELKVGYPVMLLRNLAPEKGLCNGTRLVITKLRPHVVEAKIAIGAYAGQTAFIPRIILDSSKNLLPFQLRRRQIPLSTAFAITINKSQGQTLRRVGLFIPTQVFTHGQLYVALSRIPDPANLFVCVLPAAEDVPKLRNIVYRAVFH
jgi:hypothetical protein